MMEEEKDRCKCDCHNDGRIRHTKETICCETPKVQMASSPCECADDLHVACSIEPNFCLGKAQITDTKYAIMEKLAKYTGCIQFGYDEKNKSLDIIFKRAECEWDYGAGIQINGLTKDDKEAIEAYLKSGA